jgi:hypothetical protein
MAKLIELKNHPLLPAQEPEELGADNPLVQCESCGAVDKTHRMYGFLISMGVAAHPLIPGFTCGANQGEGAYNHWTCPQETCFVDVLVACALEHIHGPVQKKIKEINDVHNTAQI